VRAGYLGTEARRSEALSTLAAAQANLKTSRAAYEQSGDAADCKSVHPGSIPGVASKQKLEHRPTMTARPIAKTSGSVAAAAASRADGKEALFRQFIEWQRDPAKQGLSP
jgi:hypothetical protein